MLEYLVFFAVVSVVAHLITLRWLFVLRSDQPAFHSLREIRVCLMNLDERLNAVKAQVSAGLTSIAESLLNIQNDISRLKDAVFSDQPKETTLADLEALGAKAGELAATARDVAAITPEPAEPPAPPAPEPTPEPIPEPTPEPAPTDENSGTFTPPVE